MKAVITIICLLLLQLSICQVTLDADGPGGTYELITSVLAPGHNPIEVPDCNHLTFGDHIDEVFDEELGIDVFRFYIHTMLDNDRCINFDRQRNEIKAYDKSPQNLLGVEGETVVYRWKFKLEEGFQSSPNFTHLHQLKSVGGSLASMPMYTLTARKANPDRLELRYAQTNSQITLTQTNLEAFIGSWVEVSETIKYGVDGHYAIEIKRISDNQILLDYTNESIINWRPDASFVRPKWGIYRSLINVQDLRDEAVLFANFSIEEIISSSSSAVTTKPKLLFSNPAADIIHLENIPKDIKQIILYDINGKPYKTVDIRYNTETQIDVSSVANGIYLLHFDGIKTKQTEKIMIMK